jgi:hypothetical protein
LHRLGAEDLLDAEPIPIRISWDQYGVRASASSSRTAREITWTFQHFARALWSALAAEPVLQHEYLSHLVPRNPDLSSRVREGWLMEALMAEIRDGGPDGQLDLRLLKYLRERLGADPELGDLAAYGSLGLLDTAVFIRIRNPALFWGVTREMLAMEPGAEAARQVDEVLRELEAKRDQELCAIFESVGPAGIAKLHEVLCGR